PWSTWKVTLSMAITGPKNFVRCWTFIMEASCAVAAVAGSRSGRPRASCRDGELRIYPSTYYDPVARQVRRLRGRPRPLAAWHPAPYNSPDVLWGTRSSSALCAVGGVAPPERFAWHASEGRLFQAR